MWRLQIQCVVPHSYAVKSSNIVKAALRDASGVLHYTVVLLLADHE